ncbi:hypothetical protein CRYO30217_00382 [Parvicella tangerina]|uniref:Uncharacterized protein n=2 Tax=Parvicella tangerina TaxID=2829795 RepID=A0A916JJT9_9FLAO|nr:hypothetical protein CRYO30217_00382 [Parvicella tangerina]
MGWHFQRLLMLILGLTYLFFSIFDFTLIGIIFSTFILSQAVFGYGCAAGNCPID